MTFGLLRYVFILVWFVISLPLIAYATTGQPAWQTPAVIQQVNSENGATNSATTSLTTDKFHRLWIASESGLFVYNGQQAKKIWPDDGRNSYVHSLVSHGDAVYVGSDMGLIRFDAQSLTSQVIISGDDYKPHRFVLIDEGIVFSQFNDGLYLFTNTTNTVTPIVFPEAVKSRQIADIYADENQHVWVTVQTLDSSERIETGGLLKLINGEVANSYLVSNKKSLTSITPKDNFLLLGATRGILAFSPQNGEIEYLEGTKDLRMVNNMTLDAQGCLWIAAMGSAKKWCNGEVQVVAGNYLKTIPKQDFESVHYDLHNNIVWFGGITNGIWGIYAPPNNVLAYSLASEAADTLNHNNVYAIAEAPNGDIWVAYNGGGIDVLSKETGLVNNIQLQEEGSRANHVLSMQFDDEGNLFVGSFGGGVWYKAADDNDFRPFIQTDNKRINKTVVMDFAFTPESIWIATIRELFLLSKDGSIIRTLPKAELLEQGHIYGVMSLDADHALLATTNGLIKLNKHSFKQQLLNPPTPQAPGCSDGMLDFTKAVDGSIWYVASALCRYDPSLGTVTSVAQHSIYETGITSIMALPDGRIVAQDGEVVIYHPESQKIEIINKENGHFIDDAPPNFGAMALINEQLVMGLSKGLLWWQSTQNLPAKLKSNPLFISGISVMNKKRPLDEANLKESMRIAYNEKIAFMEFELVDYFGQELSFSMLMPGIIDNALPLNSLKGFALPTANEGVHELTLQIDKYGTPVNSLTFPLDVLPPWWRTPYAYAGYLVVIGLMIAAVAWFRTRQLNLQNLQLSESVAKKTQEIRSILEEKETLFENISHEFRTPLTVILAKLDKLKHLGNGDIAIIHQQSQRLFDLVEKLLKLAEIRAIELANTTVLPAQALQQAIAAIMPLANEKGQRITPSGHLPPNIQLRLKEDTLPLILHNLLGNAVKYAPANSEISLLVEQKEEKLHIQVRDQGNGFTHPEQVHQRFNREHGQQPGNGLGLAIVKQMIDANQGQLHIANHPQGGALLDVWLPWEAVSQEQPLTNASEALPANTPAQSTRPHILIAEDEAAIRDTLQELLGEQYQLTLCENGQAALNALEQGLQADLILSDVMMPELDGFALCHAVKSNPEWAHIGVILLTAKADLSSQRSGLMAKADDYLSKPFNSEMLRLKIDNRMQTLQAYRQQLLDHTLLGKPISIDKSHPQAELAALIRKALQANFPNSEYRLSDLAQQLGLGERTLSRRIKSLFNSEFKLILRDFRLQQAHLMLQQGTTVKTVAWECGFSSPAYLSSCYKTHFGISPTVTLDTKKSS